jgi:nitronate monooxygenase
MSTASGSRLLDLLGIDLPIIQAPMAGATTPEMVIAVSEAGGLGSLPSALYTEVDLRAALDRVRAGTRRPINLNFFCHANPADDAARQAAWLTRLVGYYVEAGLDPNMPKAPSGRSGRAGRASTLEDPAVARFSSSQGARWLRRSRPGRRRA